MIGKRMKLLRGNKTQEEAAKEIGITRARYSHYENDRSEPEFLILIAIADYYNVSIDFLMGRTDEPKVIRNKLHVNGKN